MAIQIATNAVGRNRPQAKVTIITGGDEGIDRAIASRFAAEGADIAFFAAAVIAAARNKWVYLKGTEEVTRRVYWNGSITPRNRSAGHPGRDCRSHHLLSDRPF
jgi:NAD(P)-dependent dehydrogenase (short-subunit alcohol dehydrogenase family)